MSESLIMPPMSVMRKLSTIQALNARQRVFEEMNNRALATIDARGIPANRMRQFMDTEGVWWSADDEFYGLHILNEIVNKAGTISDPLEPFVKTTTILRSNFVQPEGNGIDEAAYARQVDRVILSRDMAALACMAEGYGVVLIDSVIPVEQLGVTLVDGTTIGLEVPIL